MSFRVCYMPNALLIIIHPFDDQSKRKYNGAVVPSVNSFTELKQQKKSAMGRPN